MAIPNFETFSIIWRLSISNEDSMSLIWIWNITFFAPNGALSSRTPCSKHKKEDTIGLSIFQWSRTISINTLHPLSQTGTPRSVYIPGEPTSSFLNTHVLCIWQQIHFQCIRFVPDWRVLIKISSQFKEMTILAVVYLLFRSLDIWKPRRCQSLRHSTRIIPQTLRRCSRSVEKQRLSWIIFHPRPKQRTHASLRLPIRQKPRPLPPQLAIQ